MRRPPTALLVAGAAVAFLLLRAPLWDAGFLRDDYGMLAREERLGPREALVRGATERFLGFVNDFWRPTSAAAVTLTHAAVGPRPFAWRVVSFLLVLATAASLVRLARRFFPDASLAALGGGALAVSFPLCAETFGWAVAGQQDLLAVALLAAAAERLAAGSFLSVGWALLAYGAKESAFVFPGLAVALALALPRDHAPSRRRMLLLAAAHAAAWVLAFFVRWRVLGRLTAPYAADPSGGFLGALAAGSSALPSGVLRALGPVPLGVFGLLVLAALVHRRPRAAVAALLAAASALAPTLLLPGGEPRFFAVLGLAVAGATMLLGAAAGLPGALAVVAAAGGAAFASREPTFAFRERTDRSDAVVAAVRALPGRHVLIAELPDAFGWTFPFADLPPFAPAGREVYPQRLLQFGGTTLSHLRPRVDDSVLATFDDARCLVVPEDASSATTLPTPTLTRRADGAYVLAEPGAPLRAIPWLRLRGPRGTKATASAAWTLPSGARRSVRVEVPLAEEHDALVPLLDAPAFPIAANASVVVEGARVATVGPPPPLAMRLRFPAPGATLTPADAARPFDIENLPAGTAGLRLTVGTAGGAAPFVVAGPILSFHAADAANGGWLWKHVATWLEQGVTDLYLGVEALADLSSPASVLDRTPYARFTLAWPAR